MRRIIPWAAAALALSATPLVQAAGYTDTVLGTPGLLSYYQFNGTFNSSVGGYTGTATTGATLGAAGTGPTLADNPTNRPVNFTGTAGNSVNTNQTGGISTAGSIAAWINLATLPSTAGRIFYIAGESQGGNDFDLQIQSDNKIYFYTDTVSATATPTALAAGNLNQWIFVVGTFSANNDRDLYINGANVASSVPGGHAAGGNAYTIGYSNVFSGREFQGGIDEVAFFNTELTATQVANLYAARTVVPEPACLGLVAGAGLLALGRRRR